MKKRVEASKTYTPLIIGVTLLSVWGVKTQILPAIPEPGLIIYGSVINTNASGNGVLSSGIVNWTVGGNNSTSTVPSTIINVEGQYFYLAKVPFETRAVHSNAFLPTPNVMSLSPVAASYTRSPTVNGSNAVIAFSSRGNLGTFPFGGAIRGQLERVDLQVDLARESFSDWALRFFGTTNLNPNADADQDHATNYEEYLAGTDPSDNQSLFILTSIVPSPSGGIDVRWQSVAYKTYTLLRSSNVSTGYTALESGIAATAPTNLFHDPEPTGLGPCYYRVKLESPDVPVGSPAPFKLIDIQPNLLGGFDLRWESQANRSYSVYRSTNLSQGFINLQAFLPATPGTNTFRDTTATGSGPYFYRIKLE